MIKPYSKRYAKALDLISTLKPLFDSQNIAYWAEPEVLQAADLFIALSGEDIRKRMVLTESINGQQLALRPEFTVPICHDLVQAAQQKNIHLNEMQAVGYHGEAWRLREDREFGAFQQAGIEWVVTTDEHQSDAIALEFALDACEALNLQGQQLVINDIRLFQELLESLSLSPSLKNQIEATYSAGRDLRSLIQNIIENNQKNEKAITSAIDPEAAQTMLHEVFSTLGLENVGGRSGHEIANRFVQKMNNQVIDEKAIEELQQLDALLALHIPCKDALEVLDFIASKIGNSFAKAVEAFKEKLSYFEQNNIDLDKLIFNGEMPAKQAYYTGLIFAVRNQSIPHAVYISGGRYDALFEKLGADRTISAVGCSIWLDDIADNIGENK